MSTTLEGKAGAGGAARIISEGYGTGAWHGPDLKAALGDVTTETAFWRPGPDRHNIAEIATHHAYCVRNVRAKLTGVEAEPFVLEGDDWFALPDASTLSWSAILGLVEREQEQLAALAAGIDAGRTRSVLPDSERFDLLLGITCHAVYHAGQVQLIKKVKTT
ncbi:MAG TPA: DinB family protein [Vicinamibacterales bacterium]|nr:DinB family protein [Vicinamibacterales bacterium]